MPSKKTPKKGDKIVFRQPESFISNNHKDLIEGKTYIIEEVLHAQRSVVNINDLDSTIDLFDGRRELSCNTSPIKPRLKLKNVEGLFAFYWFHPKKLNKYSSAKPQTEEK